MAGHGTAQQSPGVSPHCTEQLPSLTSAAPSMTDGLDVLVHEVMAAMTTEPLRSSAGCPLKEKGATLPCCSGGMAKP